MSRKPARPARFYAHFSDIAKRNVMEDARRPSLRPKYAPQPKTGPWLLDVEELARECGTSPEHIKSIAGRGDGITLSWVSTKGDCISRHELPVWRRLVEEEKKH